MKKLLVFVIQFFLLSAFASAKDIYKVDSSHANINWKASHFGFSSPSGKFSDVSGVIEFDSNRVSNSSVDIKINAESISTGLKSFDDHLKSADFFDVKNHPVITFKSIFVSPYKKNMAKIRGELTLLGTTKIVNLDTRLNKIGTNPINGKKTIGFSARTKIKRSDFKMNFGLPGISDEVEIDIELEGNFVESKHPEKNSYMRKKSGGDIPKWNIIEDKSEIKFIASQNNSKIEGEFKKFYGDISFHKLKLNKSKVEIEIDISSVDMPFKEAISTIKNNIWLAPRAYPKAVFKADRFYETPGKNAYRAEGILTLKNKSKKTSVDFVIEEYDEFFAKIKGSTILKRSDFNIGHKKVKEAQGVDNKVEVQFVIFASKTKL